MKKVNKGRFAYYIAEPAAGKGTGLTVIFYHGWGTCAKNYLDLAGKIAEEGYVAIVPELVYHDTRHPVENPFRQETVQEYFWKTIFESIDEFEEFMQELGILASKTIVAGNSMGGFIAAGIMARHKQLGGLASINGSGSFLLMERVFRKRDRRPGIALEAERLWKKYDPLEQQIPTAPVLLLHGKADQTIPVEGQMHYYQYLTEKNGFQNVQFKLYEGVNHQFTDAMAADFLAWLDNRNQHELVLKELVSPCISREIKELLGYVTSLEKIESEYVKYLDAANRKLYGFELEGEIVSCLGVEFQDGNQIEIKHIAIMPDAREKLIGSSMIQAVFDKHSPYVMVAETDQDAVGFYRKNGFTIASLGEKYPGIERFWCERKMVVEQTPIS
ncbi:GNAT family N-acetyltransferase [Planococcus shenhongbingii]|uniref:GNAT family N-acetyltransferase n=1 Tax=Planococcus shenhongbingii TaxID=3058398 RepID=A0ABT8NBS0_9BACL|nr:GNAT family N-acetyltransferase [Planococcus sp. N017]MDN7245337.1 GNAT family N-acetyltransferase [Planococcus sp. N017]